MREEYRLRYLLLGLVSFLIGVCTHVLSGDCLAARDGRVKSGTGFYVSQDGHLLTSAHVVAGCVDISVWGQDGAQRAATIVATDRKLDIALLHVAGKVARYVQAPSPNEPVEIGEELFALGYGVIVKDPKRPVPIRGVYVGNDTNPAGVRVRVIHARLREGESGGAVLGSNGGLFGMVIGRFTERPDHGVLLSAFDIEAFLSAYRLRLVPDQSNSGPSPQNVLTSVSVLIQCVSPTKRNPQPVR